MAFPPGMRRGVKPSKELRAKVDKEIARLYGKDPNVTGKAVMEKLHAQGLKIGYGPITKRLKKLRANGTAAHLNGGSPDAPPHAEVEELETSLSHTPLSNGKVRVVLATDLSPQHAGIMVLVIGQVLGMAAREVATAAAPAPAQPTGVALPWA